MVRTVEIVKIVEVLELVDSSIDQMGNQANRQFVIEAIHHHLTIRHVDDLTCFHLTSDF